MNKEFMKLAIKEAKKAYKEGEVPVGAVIVKDGVVIAKGRNSREKENSALGHAEINAIKKACKKLNDWRLDGCELYVTLEPCPMCAGAIINARIKTVVFGAFDAKMGSLDSKTNLANVFDFKPETYAGICENECTEILKDFFKDMRND